MIYFRVTDVIIITITVISVNVITVYRQPICLSTVNIKMGSIYKDISHITVSVIAMLLWNVRFKPFIRFLYWSYKFIS